jgi:hypothetical protein
VILVVFGTKATIIYIYCIFANNNTTYICSGGTASDNNLVVYSSGASGAIEI